jgi:hypothetical protein
MLLLALWACGDPCPVGHVCSVAGTGDAGFIGDGDANKVELYLPTDAIRMPDGRLLVDDYNNYRLRALDDDGQLVTIAGSGAHGYSNPGSAALDSPLENPIAVAYGPDGLLYIAAEHEGRVLRVSADDTIEVVAGDGILELFGDGGPASSARLSDPTGIAFDDDGVLYISDSVTNRVRAIRDGLIDTVIGGGTDPDGAGRDVSLTAPQHIRWDAGNHRLIVADSGSNRILAWDPIADVVTDAAPGCDLSDPRDAAPDLDGSLLIADGAHHQIVGATAAGCMVLVGSGYSGTVDNHGARVTADVLYYPSSVLVDSSRDVYVASTLSNQIVRWRR